MTVTITIDNTGPADTLDCIIQSNVINLPFAKLVSMLETITADMLNDYMHQCRQAIQQHGPISPDEMEQLCMQLPLPRVEMRTELLPPGPGSQNQ